MVVRARQRDVARRDLAAVAAAGTVNAIVETPDEIVHHGLHVQLLETAEDFLAHVRFAVAIGVFEIPNIRRSRDIHAVFPASDAGRPRQVLSEDRRLVEDTIIVRVLQQSHAANRLVGGVLLARLVIRFVGVRIIAHLAHIGAAILVIRHRHGAGDERFGGEQVHAKTVEHLERLRSFGRRGRRNGWQFARHGTAVGLRHQGLLLGEDLSAEHQARKDKDEGTRGCHEGVSWIYRSQRSRLRSTKSSSCRCG